MRKNKMVKGVEYIRTAPVLWKGRENFFYTTEPLVFDGINEDGCLIMHFPPNSEYINVYGPEPFTLNKIYSDGNWRPVTYLKNGVKSSLDKYKNKKIRRVKPIIIDGEPEHFYCQNPLKLVSATRYHLVLLIEEFNEEFILDSRFADPNDWELAE